MRQCHCNRLPTRWAKLKNAEETSARRHSFLQSRVYLNKLFLPMYKTAVIIAGGEGSRLKPLSNNKPKAMVVVNARPMLYWILRWLKFHGVKNVVLGVAYKKEKIISYL